MHSYAQGEPMPIPGWVYVSIGLVVVIGVVAYIRNHQMEVKELKQP